MKTILSFLAALLLVQSAPASTIVGFWSGTAVRGGEARPVSLRVDRSDQGFSAAYDIPSLALEGIPVRGFAFDPATGEISSAHELRGRVDNGRLTGELAPATLHGPPVRLDLERAAPPPAPATLEREVEFVSRGLVLRGRLVSPKRPGRFPAMVSLHGSGPATRWLALARARRFAEAGYAMLIYDKPGSGRSEGDWTMTSLDELAQDAVSAVEFLRAQPETNPQKVGLWGHSQAGQVISRASAMSNDIAFVIVLAGGGATPREVEDYGYLSRLRRAGANQVAAERAMAWVRDYFEYVATGRGYDALTARLTREAGEEWVRALGIAAVYPTPAQRPKWQWVATYDPAVDIARMRMPVLLLFAELDQSTPTERSLTKWRQGLMAAGNRHFDWRVFGSADHHFLVAPEGDGWPSLARGFYETQFVWLARHVAH